ncbi:MAG TPA: nickel-dependent hydrogenase large subunit [bacterium]|nr:nickel-dependent hydrogenase large subunit [bacterium]
MTRTIMPFGPQHPVLPEPIHLDLELEDEIVVGARPSIGYVHRGLEKLCETRDYTEFTFVAERVCGICSFIHGMTYCQGIEELLGVAIPPRAQYLRVVWSELSRLHSHLLWLGLLADAFGFEALFMQSWRLRELVLDCIELTTGGRVIFSSACPGGVRRDVTPDQAAFIRGKLTELEQRLGEIVPAFLNDPAVRQRLAGVGVITRQQAETLGAVGPVARASGVAMDMRTSLRYAAYDELPVEPIIANDGDCLARCRVRIGELTQSIGLIRTALDRLPAGELAVKVTGNPTGDIFARAEQPRGEVIYHLKGNGTKFLQRFRVRTPTFANLPALLAMLPGSALADVPVLVLTIDPCISCTER